MSRPTSLTHEAAWTEAGARQEVELDRALVAAKATRVLR